MVQDKICTSSKVVPVRVPTIRAYARITNARAATVATRIPVVCVRVHVTTARMAIAIAALTIPAPAPVPVPVPSVPTAYATRHCSIVIAVVIDTTAARTVATSVVVVVVFVVIVCVVVAFVIVGRRPSTGTSLHSRAVSRALGCRARPALALSRTPRAALSF
ncbi:hypothetical protein EDB84DRAFT_1584694 [Lactarius hengduanensis]|nr:hypothetical protein EDB84DRAFT_1584694 [Lactarius hengduanensis]